MRWSDRRGGEGREDAAAVDKPLRQTHEKQGLGVLGEELCLLTSHVTRHSSHVTRHATHITCHTWQPPAAEAHYPQQLAARLGCERAPEEGAEVVGLRLRCSDDHGTRCRWWE
jgi:hypothetical protein